jgi:tetratricopeptide (TPR) repeat protein
MGLRRSFAFPALAPVLATALLVLACGQSGDSPTPEAEAPVDLPEALAGASEAMGRGDYDQARELLAKLDRGGLSPAQQALAYRLESQLHSVADEFAPALESLQRALDSGGLTPEDQVAVRYDQGWLHAQLGQSAQAVAAYESFQKALQAEPTTLQLLTMSESYAAARDCATASAMITKAHARITPEERIDVAVALEVVRPLCPSDPGLAKLGDVLAGQP